MDNMKNKKISILHYVEGTDDDGFPVQQWEPLAENIWAYYRSASGNEFYAAAEVQQKVEAIFQINYRDDIDASMKILYKDKEYNITRIDDFEGNKTDLKIYAYYTETSGN